MGLSIGIDFGLNNCVMAIAEKDGVRILQNKEDEMCTPAVVGWYKGDFLIGSLALNRWELAPEDTVFSIKRLMGRAVSDPEVEKVKQDKWIQFKIVEPSDGTRDSVRVILGGKEYSPVAISAMILRKLKEDAELILGEKVTHAVITVPAYFSDKQRHATSEAGEKAGLTVMKILDEPTAAAIAFGIDSKEQEPKTILVYDLGGGTFDISVLLMAAGSYAPLNLEGDMWLGGDNFDQTIIDYVEGYVKKEYKIDPTNNKRFMVKLRLEVQEAKEALSSSRATDLIISGILHDEKGNIVDVEVEITRDKFEDMIRPLVDRTVTLVRKAIENANLTFNDIDYVLLAGNASSVPLVQESLEKLFGKEKLMRKVHPQNSVAIGAALQAVAIIDKIDMNIGNVALFHYGFQAADDKFLITIHRGDPFETPINERLIHTFYTRRPNQRIIRIPVYGGNYLDCASKNEKHGEVLVILPANCDKHAVVRIKLWLDKDGMFDVSARLADGTQLAAHILRGEIDQKVVDIYAECEAAYLFLNKRYILPREQIKMIDQLRNEVLFELVNRQFSRGIDKADDLKKIIDEIFDSRFTKFDRDKIIDQAKDDFRPYSTFELIEYGIRSTFELLDILERLDITNPNWPKDESVKAHVTKLIEYLDPRHWLLKVRNSAAIVLSKIKDPLAVGPLINALYNDVHIAKIAAFALGEVGDSKAVKPLLTCLLRGEDIVRRCIYDHNLNFTGEDIVIRIPGHKPGESDGFMHWNDVRHAAIEALGKIGNPMALNPLAVCMEKDKSPICETAKESFKKIIKQCLSAKAIEDILHRSLLKPLINGLKHRDPDMRAFCAEALGELNDSSALDHLRTLVSFWKFEKKEVKHAAREAISRIDIKRK